MDKFYADLKKNLAEMPKDGSKKDIDLAVKADGVDPKGVGIRIDTIGKDSYGKYIEEQEYMKNCLSIVTLGLKLKDPAQAEAAKAAFEQFKPMLLELPPVKQHLSGKLDAFIRVKDNKINADIVVSDETAQKKIKEIGIDITEYNDFSFIFRTAVDLAETLELTLKEVIEKALSLILEIKDQGTNLNYVLKAIDKTLTGMTIPEDKIKKLKKLQGLIGMIRTFIEGKIKFKFDAKEISHTLTENFLAAKGRLQEYEENFEGGKGMLQSIGGDTAKGMLEGFGLMDVAKALDIDEIFFGIFSTEYKNGVGLTLNLPGITKVIAEKLLA